MVTLPVKCTVKAFLPPAEGEKSHWGGYANIDANIPCLRFVTETASSSSAAGENAGHVAISALINQLDGFIEVIDSVCCHYWTEYLCRGYLTFERYIDQNRGAQEIPLFISCDRRFATIKDHFCTILNSLVDYPLELSPLAKRKPGSSETVERFEGFAGGMELCNAFSELNDPLDQEERFLAHGRAYEAGDEEAHQMDRDWLTALSYGMPPTGGFGMGIDRLTMLLTDQVSIREVILFPHMRTKEES